MLWVLLGYLTASYGFTLWTRIAARTAVSLARSQYLSGVNVYAVALALFVISPVYAPLAGSFLFFAVRPRTCVALGSLLGVEHARGAAHESLQPPTDEVPDA